MKTNLSFRQSKSRIKKKIEFLFHKDS